MKAEVEVKARVKAKVEVKTLVEVGFGSVGTTEAEVRGEGRRPGARD